MASRAELAEKIGFHLSEMSLWAEGRKSFTNYGPHAPYTPDVIAVMDAQEVVKHSAAAQGYIAALTALDGGQDERTAE